MTPLYVDPVTGKQLRQPYRENRKYAGMVRRLLRALGRRAATDIDLLPVLVALQADLDAALRDAVDGIRADGYSWDEVAKRLGTTKQAAWHRFGRDQPGTAIDRQHDIDSHLAV